MKVFLLGTCKITVEDREVILPYKKSLALLIYLIDKNTCLRDDIVHLFWGEMNEHLAKKNLRNAVYTLRKHLGKGIIQSPKRELLTINKEMIKDIDYQSIDNLPIDVLLELKDTTYAKGLYFNDAPYLELWLDEMRQEVQSRLATRYVSEYHKVMNEKQYCYAEQLAYGMIERDEYNEQGYRYLFEALRQQGKYSTVITMYNKLSNKLNNDLLLKPDDDTRRLYEEIMAEKVSVSSPKPDNIFGRNDIINSLIADVYTTTRTKVGKTIVLTGESGIGKSAVVDAFYKILPVDVYSITIRCYEAEKNYMLSPWFPIVKELLHCAEKHDVTDKIPQYESLRNMVMGIVKVSDENGKLFINFHQIETMVSNIAKALKDKTSILIYFDDVQWLDELSIKLISELEGTSIIFVMTFNTEMGSLENFKYSFRHHRYFQKMEVPPLEKIHAYQMIRHLASTMVLDEQGIEEIVHRSQGNPLFISELINARSRGASNVHLPNRITDIMRIRYNLLENDEKKILHMASHFYDFFFYEDIKAITGADDFSLFEPLTNLTIKKILVEDKNRKGQPIFRFSHHLMRAFIYNQVPESLRKIYHQKIGLYIEKQAMGEYKYFTCIRLIHHFSASGEQLKEMNYRLILISNYLNKNNEMFPIINRTYDEGNTLEIIGNDDEVKYELDKIMSLYEGLKTRSAEDKLEEMTFLNYWYLIGRHNIVSGDEHIAINCIEKLIDNAKSANNLDFLIKGYLLKSYYHINRYEPIQLQEALQKADDIISSLDNQGLIGIIKRLRGYSDILNGNIETGLNRIEEALEIFEKMSDKESYILNIVGCHYYTGEGYRLKGEYDEAVKYYSKAIDYCLERGFENKLAFLYGARGQCYYELDHYVMAERDINSSLASYKKSPEVWGSVVSKAYYALLCLERKDYKELMSAMKVIDKKLENMHNCYYRVVVFRVKSEICYRLSTDKSCAIQNYKEILGKKFCKKMLEIMEQEDYRQEEKLIQKTKSNCLICISQ